MSTGQLKFHQDKRNTTSPDRIVFNVSLFFDLNHSDRDDTTQIRRTRPKDLTGDDPGWSRRLRVLWVRS